VAIVNSSSDAIVSKDLRGIVRSWNPAAERLFGYTAAEMIGQPITKLIAPDRQREEVEILRRIHVGESVEHYETERLRKDGSIVHVSLSVSPVIDSNGVVIGASKIARDITEHHLARRRTSLLAELSEAFGTAREPHEILRAAAEPTVRFLNLTRCLLVDVDETGDRATVSYDSSDGPAATLVGAYAIDDFHTPAERQRLSAGHAIVIADTHLGSRSADEVARFDTLGVRSLIDAPHVSGGRWRFVLRAMRDEPSVWRAEDADLLQEVAARTYLRLERARADRALRAAHDTFHQLVEQSPFGVYAIDADFRLVQVSAGAQKAFATVRPLIGRDFSEVMRTLWPEPFATEAIGHFRQTLDTGLSYHAPGMVERRHDIGIVESYDWKIQRVMLPDGRFGVVCHFYDLTERQRYEAALRDADRQKDEFLATLAHELRNPLAPIRTSAGILKSRASIDPLVARCRHIIDRQTTQMARLLDDLLDVSRLSRGRLALQRAPVLLQDVIEAAAETSQPLIDKQGHRLVIHHDAEDVLVDGDATRLTQVFANILNNAAKYSPPGGRIDLFAGHDARAVVVRVRDTGYGIPPEKLGRVFDLFTQAHDETGPAGGLGIGLSLARRLVELHGGTIKASSEGSGKGSEFEVWLPIVLQEPGELSEPAEPVTDSARNRRVLVADDNVDAADTTKLLLESIGCDARVAYDGRSALAEAERFRPDVVFLDLGMPGIDGYEVCRRMRAEPHGGHARIVALSGWGQEGDRRRSAAAGFDEHLIKPVDPDALFRLVKEDAGRPPR
jgi:PAS domain S-box-containing protein